MKIHCRWLATYWRWPPLKIINIFKNHLGSANRTHVEAAVNLLDVSMHGSLVELLGTVGAYQQHVVMLHGLVILKYWIFIRNLIENTLYTQPIFKSLVNHISVSNLPINWKQNGRHVHKCHKQVSQEGSQSLSWHAY